jgi:MFS transporter, DHA1 family, tetracycline resistance protein
MRPRYMSTHKRRLHRRVAILLSIVAIDAAGIGVMFPVLPGLLRRLTGSADVSLMYGAVVASYAFAQFVFAPVLGALSDRFGRRPVLLVSIGGAALDYGVMAFTPVTWGLLIGRLIAGATSANVAVAASYITDLTSDERRTRYIGYVSGAYSAGFILGPVIGGVLNNIGSRMPFLAAASLCGLNLALAYFMLPESRTGPRALAIRLDPLGQIRRLLAIGPLARLMATYGVIELIANFTGTVWALYGLDHFHWNAATLGASFAAHGVFHVISLGLVAGRLALLLGERRAIIVGIVCDCVAMISIAAAHDGWVAFALTPLFAIGSIGHPILQSGMTRLVDADTQGEMQGVLSSVTSFASIIGPLIASAAYAATRASWTGSVWIIGAACYALTVPSLRSGESPPTRAATLERSAAA